LLVDLRTRRSVAFLVQPFGGGLRRPVGTVFFVSMQYAPPDNVSEPYNQHFNWHEQVYAITAKHNLTGSAQFFVRLRTEGGQIHDEPVDAKSWLDNAHPDADVAVLRWDVENDYHWEISGDHELADEKWLEDKDIDVGTRLFSVSLFTTTEVGKRRGEADRWNAPLPVARFGTLALGLGLVPMREAGKNVTREAYLAEFHSWGGMSGAPCYAYQIEGHDRAYALGGKRDARHWSQGSLPGFGRLLGLVSGHFPVREAVEVTPEMPSREVIAAVNSGIAVITPAKYIKELLMRPKLVSDRTRRAKREDSRVEGAIPDRVSPEPSEALTRGEFYDALGKITKEPPAARPEE